MIYYESIDLRFKAIRSPYEVFGNFTISKLKRLSNALGLPHIGDTFRGFSDTGSKIKVPDESFMLYEIKVNRVTAADLLLEENGCDSLYKMAHQNNDEVSNYYSSLNTDADMKLSYLVNKLPPDCDIPGFLDKLEARSERIGPESLLERTEGYCYRGIPRTLIIAIWIMRRFTGYEEEKNCFYNMLDGDTFNPRLDTLQRYATAVGSALGAFVKAIENKMLILSFSESSSNTVDNSKSMIVDRLISASGCNSLTEFSVSVPVSKRKTVRNFMQNEKRAVQTTTVLQILSFVHLNLSDVIK